ncbi:hypothetical protein K435DRAFT_822972 [Dendrothele bispora CBS 962.96]|uniref:Uncharacterized protein n=1 Tax=Dendrothele bispora (strain CBS 962.96) TaxID=1314807 RepID=A0A4S8L4Q2_DENBC|nr:hypothetical protein K435DRAFT_822972 [Dendrothele bispora CBS 962.96]
MGVPPASTTGPTAAATSLGAKPPANSGSKNSRRKTQPLDLALTTHIRLLARFLKEDDVPKPPSEALVRAFDQKFCTDAVYEGLSQLVAPAALDSIHEEVEQLRSAQNAKSTSTHLRNISRVPETKLISILTAVHAFGLSEWWPDYTGNFNTRYNNAHRAVALSTFQDAANTHAYNHLTPIRSQVNNMDLLVRMYDHYVHHYLKNQALAELKFPGATMGKYKKTAMYKRRQRLQKAREDYLIEQGFPSRVVDLFHDVEAVSEDEFDEARQVYLIRSKPGRSTQVTEFAAEIDKRRLQNKSMKRGARQPVPRIRPDQPIEPSVNALPGNDTPIDWYDPTWFNERDDWKVFFGNSAEAERWKNMKTAAFMETDGNETFAKYQLPSTETLATLAGNDGNDEVALTEEQKEQAKLLKQARTRRKGQVKDKGKRKASEDVVSDDETVPGPSKKPRTGEPSAAMDENEG